MIDIDPALWWRGVILLTAAFCFVVMGWKYLRYFSEFSRAQKLYLGAMQFFMAGIAIRAVEAIYYSDAPEFRYALVPWAVGFLMCFAYLVEPTDRARRRHGRHPYDPKEPGEI